MVRFIAVRLARLVGVLAAVSAITFSLVSLLPGDPALQVLGTGNATAATIRQVRHQMGLDQSLPHRYAVWLGHALTGNLGRSIKTHEQVASLIGQRMPVTVELVVLSLVIALVIAIPLGVWTAYRAGTWSDKLASGLGLAFLAMPPFVVGLILVYLLAVKLQWLPATGWVHLSEDPVQNLRSALMPSIALALGNIAVFMRLLRADMRTTLQEDHVLMARAKGMPTPTILFRHALRPSLFSVLTVLGVQVGALIGGAVVVESIFALPGVGSLLVDSILQRDIIVVQGIVLVIATIYVLANFLVDMAYTVLDPRLRSEVRRGR